MADLTSSALQQRLDGLTLPDGARVWMYTANRVLTDAEKLNDMQLKSLEQVMENETAESEMGQPETGREMNE